MRSCSRRSRARGSVQWPAQSVRTQCIWHTFSKGSALRTVCTDSALPTDSALHKVCKDSPLPTTAHCPGRVPMGCLNLCPRLSSLHPTGHPVRPPPKKRSQAGPVCLPPHPCSAANRRQGCRAAVRHLPGVAGGAGAAEQGPSDHSPIPWGGDQRVTGGGAWGKALGWRMRAAGENAQGKHLIRA